MTEASKSILIIIHTYLEANPTVRFGQALSNLNIIQFADRKNPAKKDHLCRDIYNDDDKQILKRITL